MSLLNQLNDEIHAAATNYVGVSNVLATYPQHTFVALITELGHDPESSVRLSYHGQLGLVTVEPCNDSYVTLYDRDRGGYVWRCFDPIESIKHSHCQHNWVETQGLFRSYLDCSKCGAKHEALQTA